MKEPLSWTEVAVKTVPREGRQDWSQMPHPSGKEEIVVLQYAIQHE
jgi:hypothetical protein